MTRMRPQRQMWITSVTRPEKIKLGKGWCVRLRLKPWRSRIPVPWSAPVVARRTAAPYEVQRARLLTPYWPDSTDEGFVLIFADGGEWTAPTGFPLTTQRMRSPARVRESKEWYFK